MEVEAFVALMRMSECDDEVVANLAKIGLGLAQGIREAEARAELAEATLEAERVRFQDMVEAARQQNDAGLPRPVRQQALRDFVQLSA